MAPPKPGNPNGHTKAHVNIKLPRLPKNARVQKRPILRPAIPSPYAGADQQKVVYISASTPFVSAVKRVRKLLTEIEKRSMGKVDLIDGKGSDKQKLRTLGEAVRQGSDKKPEEVLLKATNRAIEKVLGIALFFQGQQDCQVRIRTGSVGVVDDIVEVPRDVDHTEDGNGDGGEGEEGEEELPESRVRKMTSVEVAVTLK